MPAVIQLLRNCHSGPGEQVICPPPPAGRQRDGLSAAAALLAALRQGLGGWIQPQCSAVDSGMRQETACPSRLATRQLRRQPAAAAASGVLPPSRMTVEALGSIVSSSLWCLNSEGSTTSIQT